jgi:hypothetical protein
MPIATTIAVAGAVVAGLAQGVVWTTIAINAAIALGSSLVLGAVSNELPRKPS